MTTFCVSGKFAKDARKAFFFEMTSRLEKMVKTLHHETSVEAFDEMIEILQALKRDANSAYVEKIFFYGH